MPTRRDGRSLTKALRGKVRNRFDGCCAYCGDPLDETFHVDHVEPALRGVHEDTLRRLGMRPGEESEDNYFPACRPCNQSKGTLTVPEFRTYLRVLPTVLARDSSQLRMAVKFGQVKLKTGAPVKFHFEKFEWRSPR